MSGRLSAKGTALVLIAGAVGLAVFAYNVWSYSCGYCTGQTFLTLGPAGYALLGLIAAALLTLITLRIRRRIFASHHRCQCGYFLEHPWKFCPDCGLERS